VIYTGKAHLVLIIVSPAKLEAEGDRIFKSHAECMEGTHFRESEKALLRLMFQKALTRMETSFSH
jgi:hypothetical protein